MTRLYPAGSTPSRPLDVEPVLYEHPGIVEAKLGHAIHRFALVAPPPLADEDAAAVHLPPFVVLLPDIPNGRAVRRGIRGRPVALDHLLLRGYAIAYQSP